MQTRKEALFAKTLPIAVVEQGEGRSLLLLHGGAGPASMDGFASQLAAAFHVIAPAHPGFDGEPRPDWFHSVDDLALAYLCLIDTLQHQGCRPGWKLRWRLDRARNGSTRLSQHRKSRSSR